MDGSHALSISVSITVEGLAVVRLDGELDITSSGQLLDRLSEIATAPRVVVDVAGLTFVDSSGLNTLIRAAREVEANGGWMAVAGATDQIARVFGLVRLAQSVRVEVTLSEALARASEDAMPDRTEAKAEGL
jgi:stage II sporulation protein AA (anti-sigma F factor antagonist)